MSSDPNEPAASTSAAFGAFAPATVARRSTSALQATRSGWSKHKLPSSSVSRARTSTPTLRTSTEKRNWTERQPVRKLQVRTEGTRQVRRKTLIYELDAIISVGYRVNSKTATAFRQWATRVLKQRLLQDYKKRTSDAARYLAGLKNVELLAHHADADAPALLDLIGRYARSWRLLLEYDENRLPPPPTKPTKRMQWFPGRCQLLRGRQSQRATDPGGRRCLGGLYAR